jgi:SulP family sulfate permease
MRGRVRAARDGIGRWLRSVRPRKRDLRHDAVGGLSCAVGNVPDGMATAALIGVNPVYGLFANFVGPVTGGLSSSTRLMLIGTTSASALAAGSVLAGIDPDDRPDALFLLTLLAGVAMIAAGVLRLGRYARFVSHSVMIGFLTGVAVNIIAGQISKLTGVDAEGSFALEKAYDVVRHPGRIDLPSLLAGLFALAILAGLARTRAGVLGPLAALVLPTVTVLLLGSDGIATVSDAGEIPRGVPIPHLPGLGQLSVELIVGALSVTVIVLVQGVGVGESVPNRDGPRADPNRDFMAQGFGNVASAVFRGQPVGGSVSATALLISAGARTRWGPIWTGLWMLVILVALSGVVGVVVIPTLAAVLIFAGFRAIRPAEITTILRAGRTSQVALVTTFAATLFLPVAAAVGIGIALSLLLQLNQEAVDLTVVELIPDGERTWTERPAPKTLASNQVTVLDVYGSLFYAGARTLQARLPDPAGAEAPVVVLRLRGRTSLGSTFTVVVTDYAGSLARVGGRLYLSGLDHDMAERLQHSAGADVVRAYKATAAVGESTSAAYLDGTAWLVKHSGADEERPDPEG